MIRMEHTLDTLMRVIAHIHEKVQKYAAPDCMIELGLVVVGDMWPRSLLMVTRGALKRRVLVGISDKVAIELFAGEEECFDEFTHEPSRLCERMKITAQKPELAAARIYQYLVEGRDLLDNAPE